MEIVSERGNRIQVSIRGKVLKTTRNSEILKVVEAIEDFPGVFTPRDISKKTGLTPKRIAHRLHKLTREGIVIRSPAMVRTKEDFSSCYLYVLHDKELLASSLFEEYIISTLKDQGCFNEIRAYYAIHDSQIPLSSIELESQFSPLNVNLIRSTFLACGLIKGKYFKEPGCYFFWGDSASPSDSFNEKVIKERISELNSLRAKKINRGRQQQKLIHEILSELAAQRRLAIVFDSAYFEPSHKIEDSYIRPDSILYGFLCYKTKSGDWKKLGHQRKKFPLIVESKYERIGSAQVNERLPLFSKIFDQFLLLVVAKDTYGSLWHSTYELNYFAILEGRKLRDFIAEISSEIDSEKIAELTEVVYGHP